MARIDQVIVTVDVVDIDIIVVVIPVGRPRFGVLEIIAAVIKAAIITAMYAETVFTAETGAKLLVWNAPATASGIGITTVIVLPGLLCTLLILRTVLLLCGLCPLIAIAIFLLLLLGAIILLRGLGAILRLLLSVRLLLRLLGGLFLTLPAFIRLLAFLCFFAFLGFFLFFVFFLRLIFVGFLPRVAGSANKKEHQGGAKDEFHLIPRVVLRPHVATNSCRK
jgi:hypothetical protein